MAPRGSPCPVFERGHGTSPAPSGARPEELKILLGRASILEEHRALMGTVIERISSAESGLHEAVRSLLTGFEVRKNDIPFDSFAHRVRPVYIVAPETLCVVKIDGAQRIIIPGLIFAFVYRWQSVRDRAELMILPN